MTNEGRLGPPPVEPLSEVAWSRVERRLWAQLDTEAPAAALASPDRRLSRRWWIAAVPLAAAAVAVLVLAIHGRPSQYPDEPLRMVSEIAPSSGSFGDSHLELDAATALVMFHEAEHPTVLLERGAAWFTVAPRLSRPAFIVHAGDVTVRVVGTRFRVARSEERIAVEVERGQVNVQFRGSVMPVGPGQRWSSDAPARISVAARPPAAAAPAPEPPETPPAADTEATPEVAPPTAVPDKRSPARPRGPSGSGSRVDLKHGSPATAIDGDTAVSTVDRERAEYDRLAALEPRSPDVALPGYMALARGTSRWAAPALYAAGRLAVDRRDRRAETLLGIYLQRFPSGANAADARKLLARLKAATGSAGSNE